MISKTRNDHEQRISKINNPVRIAQFLY